MGAHETASRPPSAAWFVCLSRKDPACYSTSIHTSRLGLVCPHCRVRMTPWPPHTNVKERERLVGMGRGEGGFVVLPLALSIVAVLTIAVLAVTVLAQSAVRDSGRSKDRFEALYAAEGIVSEARVALVAAPTMTRNEWNASTVFPGGRFAVLNTSWPTDVEVVAQHTVNGQCSEVRERVRLPEVARVAGTYSERGCT